MMKRSSELSAIAQRFALPASAPVLRILALLGFGLMLGACSKCDVPAWQHGSVGIAPAACHDGPQ
jgi:hypothetical protein